MRLLARAAPVRHLARRARQGRPIRNAVTSSYTWDEPSTASLQCGLLRRREGRVTPPHPQKVFPCNNALACPGRHAGDPAHPAAARPQIAAHHALDGDVPVQALDPLWPPEVLSAGFPGSPRQAKTCIASLTVHALFWVRVNARPQNVEAAVRAAGRSSILTLTDPV